MEILQIKVKNIINIIQLRGYSLFVITDPVDCLVLRKLIAIKDDGPLNNLSSSFQTILSVFSSQIVLLCVMEEKVCTMSRGAGV